MVVRISDKTQNYSKVTKLLVKPKYYTRIPFIKDKEYLLSLFMTFGESLWDGVDNYSIEKVIQIHLTIMILQQTMKR